MPKIDHIRNNFNAGEISPKIDIRGDITKYHSGCLVLEGMVPLVEGGASRMPGLYFAAETKDSSKISRLIPFRVSAEKSYVVEMGDAYLRFYTDSARVETGGVPTEVVTAFLEAQLFSMKYAQNSEAMYLFNGNYVPQKLLNESDTDWTLQNVEFYPPPILEAGHTLNLTLTPSATTGTGITFTASVGANTFVSGDVGREIRYGESRATIVGFTSDQIVTCDITNAFPDTNPIAAGDWTIAGSPIGNITLDSVKKGSICTVTSIDIDGTLTDILSNGLNWWTASGSGSNEYYLTSGAAAYSATEPNYVYIDGEPMVKGTLGSLGTVQWGWGDNDTLGFNTIYVRLLDGSDPDSNAPPNSYLQRVDGTTKDLFRTDDLSGYTTFAKKYIRVNGGVIELGNSGTATIISGKVVQELESTDTTDKWTIESSKWGSTPGYPSVGVFFEQRLVTGGCPAYPQTLEFSVSTEPDNYSINPDLDDAAMSWTLNSDQVENIHWLYGADFLVVGTLGGFWRLGATDSNEPLSQLNISAKKRGSVGVRNMPPSSVPDSLVWVSLSGLVINRLDYSFENNKYLSTNMARLAEHITRGDSRANSGVVDMAFQQSPVPILWAVRADGQLIGMTYEIQEEVYAWFRVVTDGLFESVAVIANGDEEDQVWVIVKRTINGSDVRYVEYFKPHEFFSEIKNSFFVHSGITYDGGDAVTITNITQANPAVVSAVNSYVGGETIRIKDVEGMVEANLGLTKAWTVANPTAGTFELSGIDSTGWTAYTSGGTAQAVKKTFTTEFAHLIGETLDILIDGAVHPQKVVGAGGSLSLNWYGNLIHGGLPSSAIIEPTKPYVDIGQGISRVQKQRINRVMMSFYETYGAKIGPDVDHLKPVKFGDGSAPSLFTGEIEQPFDGSWGNEAPLVIKQELPLPMTLRSITYGMSLNDK